jgi:hypothetical protein
VFRRLTIVGAALLLSSVFVLPASADSSGSAEDPALSQYVEHMPSAGRGARSSSASGASSAQAVLPARVDRALARSGRTGSALKQVATSPGLGAPSGTLAAPVEVKPGSEDAAKTFSLATVRSVASVGSARLVALLVAIALISVALVATAFARSAKL